MNITEKKRSWKEQKDRLKLKFKFLTNNDLLFAEGKQNELLEKLQIRLGKSKEELQKIISEV